MRKIPNAWIVSGYMTAVCFIVLQTQKIEEAAIMVFLAFLQFLGSLLLLFPLFLIRAMGAGDIKILALVFVVLGIRDGMHAVFLALLIGGITGMIKLIYKKKLCIRVSYLFRYVGRVCMGEGKKDVYWDLQRDGTEMTIPFVWCIELGVWLKMWMAGM